MKYELTSESIVVEGHTLYRIRATKDFSNVKKGNLGGFIEKVGNLSQEGNCWVYDNACVFGNAYVCHNAWVYGNARICGYTRVSGDDVICHDAQVYGDAQIKKEVIAPIIIPKTISAIHWLDVSTE